MLAPPSFSRPPSLYTSALSWLAPPLAPATLVRVLIALLYASALIQH